MLRSRLCGAIFVAIAIGLPCIAALNPGHGKSARAGIIPALDIYRWVESTWGPFVAAGIMVLADFVAINLISGLVEGRWHVPIFDTFRFNDSIFIPLMIVGIGWSLRSWTPPLGAWYTTWWYHAILFGIATVMSAWFVWDGIHRGIYRWQQEVSPVNCYHALVFVVVTYWLLVGLMPLVLGHHPWWAILLVITGFLGFLKMADRDNHLPPEVKTQEHWIYDLKTGKSHPPSW